MPDKVLVVLEQREGSLKRSSFETVSVGLSLAKGLNQEPEAIVIGNDINNINDLSKYGLTNITHYKSSDLKYYSSSAYSAIVADYAKETGAAVILFSNTSMGRDLAPRVAVKLDAGIIIDCIKLESNSGEIIATRPVYAGKALMDAKLKSSVKVYTLRPNVFKAEELAASSDLKVNTKEVSSPNLRTKVTQTKLSEGKLDVAEADIIVSGGRGLKGPENFSLVENLADALGAAVGASRAVVDAGWRPHREQVGQTGKTVSPSLYIACGISGAIQHLAGMSSSKYIVAINKDKDAPIFSVADYGITGDLFEILPALTEEVKKIK
jgi:electron transfer flavoprotein alpha subunit